MIISVSMDQGKLWGRATGDVNAQELKPVDLPGLKFKIDDPGKNQYAAFVRSPEGRIKELAFSIIARNAGL